MDLTTTFMGLELAHPVVPASPALTGSLDALRRLEDAGAPAVVLETSVEGDLDPRAEVLERCLLRGVDSHFEALDYFPVPPLPANDPLTLISRARETLGIPVMVSLNGMEADGWAERAAEIEQAGAHALELNLYFLPTDPLLRASDLEDLYIAGVREVRERVSIPMAVKFRPAFTVPANVAMRLVEEAGADGLVIFNRFYGPDYDVDTMELVPRLVLTTSDAMRLPMTWTAILHGKTRADLALSTGVQTWQDVLKAMMAGARMTQVASVLIREGLGRIREITASLSAWLEEREYESLRQLVGSMAEKHLSGPGHFEKESYTRAVQALRPPPHRPAPRRSVLER